MIEKKFTPKRTICRVTFKLPLEWASREIAIVGDFNNWDPGVNKMEKTETHWESLLRLKPSKKYKFKYLIDGTEWRNDEDTDGYVSNPFGSEDSLLEIGS